MSDARARQHIELIEGVVRVSLSLFILSHDVLSLLVSCVR